MIYKMSVIQIDMKIRISMWFRVKFSNNDLDKMLYFKTNFSIFTCCDSYEFYIIQGSTRGKFRVFTLGFDSTTV